MIREMMSASFKRLLAVLICSVLLLPELCAQSLRECFVAMPDSLSPLLTKINREDFLDFMDSGMKAEVTNRMNSKKQFARMSLA